MPNFKVIPYNDLNALRVKYIIIYNYYDIDYFNIILRKYAKILM